MDSVHHERGRRIVQGLQDLNAIARKQEQGARDLEDHHADADDILLRIIDDPRITEAYRRIAKWYA